MDDRPGSRGPELAGSRALSVIVVSYNTRAATLACLAALSAAEAAVPLEVILVDNASSDGSAAAVRECYPRVRVLANARNAGFPAACNQAVPLASGKHILFLNPDTVTNAACLSTCVQELESDDTVGIVGCRLVYPDGRTQYECARNPFRLQDLLCEFCYLPVLLPSSGWLNRHLIGDWDHRGVRDVEAISGAFMMVRRDVLLQQRGLPDELFMYHEDLAFCLRARRAGWRIRYRGDVTTVHLHGRAHGAAPPGLAHCEPECKLRLIREAQGNAAAMAARVVFGLRAVLRLAVSALARVTPGTAELRRRHAARLDLRRHYDQLLWSVRPSSLESKMPLPPRHGLAGAVVASGRSDADAR